MLRLGIRVLRESAHVRACRSGTGGRSSYTEMKDVGSGGALWEVSATPGWRCQRHPGSVPAGSAARCVLRERHNARCSQSALFVSRLREPIIKADSINCCS